MRFRVSEPQKARIEITKLSPDKLAKLQKEELTQEQLVELFEEKIYKKWMNMAIFMAKRWDDSMHLTRDKAVAEGNKVKNTDVPNIVWQDPTLTYENFADLSQKVTGIRHKFRRTADQRNRGVSKKEAFQETLEEKRKNI